MKHLFAIVAFIVSLAYPASAQVYWSSISTGCVPASDAIQGDFYANPNDTIVAPRGGNLDAIVLICAVTPNTGAASPNTLSMTYLDSSGANRKAFVQAQLIRVNRKTGTRSVTANLRSDSSDATTIRRIQASFSGSLDFERSYYFVRIMIDRSEPSQIVRSIGIALETVAP